MLADLANCVARLLCSLSDMNGKKPAQLLPSMSAVVARLSLYALGLIARVDSSGIWQRDNQRHQRLGFASMTTSTIAVRSRTTCGRLVSSRLSSSASGCRVPDAYRESISTLLRQLGCQRLHAGTRLATSSRSSSTLARHVRRRLRRVMRAWAGRSIRLPPPRIRRGASAEVLQRQSPRGRGVRRGL